MVILSLAILNYLHVLQEPQAVATELPLNRGFAWLQTLGPGMNIGKNPQQEHSVPGMRNSYSNLHWLLSGLKKSPKIPRGCRSQPWLSERVAAVERVAWVGQVMYLQRDGESTCMMQI